jgi:hypothetical protein
VLVVVPQPLVRLAVKGQILMFLVLHQMVAVSGDTVQREQLEVQAVALATMERDLAHLLEPLVIHQQQAHHKEIMVAQTSQPTLVGLAAAVVVLVLLVVLVLQG